MGDSSTNQKIQFAVAQGDGIGPEIMGATLNILEASGLSFEAHPVEVGETVYRRGFSSGIEPGTWEVIRDSKVLLKAPISTPQGGGYKSLNVTVRKSLGLFANVRPCRAYHPFIASSHPEMDLVVIRENEEDLYAGIEHRQTDEVYQCLKLVSRPGCERICRYAFEYAKASGRKKVTCMTKDNIMKLTDGLFHRVFDEIGTDYPEIEKEHWIIDIGMAKVATKPGQFDVIVTPNLYGDILSDVTAEVAGSVGLAPSANIGTMCSMFEAIHGSAPMIAGQDKANPSGLLLAAVMMLVHLGKSSEASAIHNAWLKTIEDGVHTPDVSLASGKGEIVGTKAFGRAVIDRLGERPSLLAPVDYKAGHPSPINVGSIKPKPQSKELIGVDIFVQWNGTTELLAQKLQLANENDFQLQMVTNRGVKVWPEGFPETYLTDHWRCRFLTQPNRTLRPDEVTRLLEKIYAAQLDFIKAETLCLFDGKPGFSLGQGQ